MDDAQGQEQNQTLSVADEAVLYEYLQCFNVTEAWARTHPDATRASCATLGSRWLRKVEIQAAIREHFKAKRMEVDEVIGRLAEQARGSLKPFTLINEDGFAYFDFSSDEAKEQFHLIKEMETRRSRRVEGKGEDAEVWEDEQIKIKIESPQRALDMLAKYHQLYTEKDDDGNPLTDEQRIARVVSILDAARARRDRQAPAESSPDITAGSEAPIGSS